MLWEIDIESKGESAEHCRACDEYNLLTQRDQGHSVIRGASRGYLLEGDLDRQQAERLMNELLVDALVETGRLGELNATLPPQTRTILLKPGVMDPLALSVVDAART